MARMKKPFSTLIGMSDVVQEVAMARNVPSLTVPGAAEVVAPAPAVPGPADGEARAMAPLQDREPIMVETVTRSPGVDRRDGSAPDISVGYLRFRCPGYVKEQLEMRRSELRRQGKRVTESYLVLKALRADGIYIADEDFNEDGRRLREYIPQKPK